MSLILEAHNLTMSYDSSPILNGVEFSIRPGELVGLLGANGAGKSTLLHCFSKVLTPSVDTVFLSGRDIRQLPAGDVAQQLAVVPQETGVDFDFTVEEMVMMGRFPHRDRWQREKGQDKELAWEAMKLTGIESFANRPVNALSGGERQRVIIARALCQEPKVLLLDEPTANLDIGYQMDILNLVAKLNREKGVTVIAAIHDINLAMQYFNTFLLLSKGKVLAAGKAKNVFTPENIKEAYGVDSVTHIHPLHGHMQVTVFRDGQKPTEEKLLPVHIIAGGLETLPVLEALREAGYACSIGPVSAQDSCYHYAGFNCIPAIKVDPFSIISAEEEAEHYKLINHAQVIIVPPIAVGEMNLSSIKAAEKALDIGKPVILIAPDAICQRDFTAGGKAADIYTRMIEKGAVCLSEPGIEQILNFLHELEGKRSSSNDE